MLRHRDPHPPDPEHRGPIHSKRHDRASPCWRQADDFCSVLAPTEMLTPLLQMWMKQGHRRTITGVHRGRTVRLKTIAHRAGETEVRKPTLSAGSQRFDVFDLELSGREFLSREAVCTPIIESLANPPLQGCGDVGAHKPAAATLR